MLVLQTAVDAELLDVADVRLLELAKLDFLHNGGSAQFQSEELRRAVGVGGPAGRLIIGAVHENVSG